MTIKQTLLSSIGQKVVLATTGLIMFFFFLVPHMAGNIVFLFGPDPYNTYAEHLHRLVWLLIQMEIVMLAALSIHMIMAVRVVLENARARHKRLTLKSSEKRSCAARFMPVSGGMIFLFILKHLYDFKFHEKQPTELNGHMVNDVYTMVLTRFQTDHLHTVIYLLFMLAVGCHLSHALQSSLQTFGVYIPRERSKVKLLSNIIAYSIAGTFAIIPVVAFFR